MKGRLLAALAVVSTGVTGGATVRVPAQAIEAARPGVQPRRERASVATSKRQDPVDAATAQHRREAQYRRTKTAAEMDFYMCGGRYL